MATLTGSEINELMLDRAQANVSTDAPLTAAERLRFINDAYADIYALSDGRIKKVTSATAWTSAEAATGVVTGILLDIQEIQDVFASGTSGSTGFSSGDTRLQKVEKERIQALRNSSNVGTGHGTYSRPKLYSTVRLDAANVAASVGLLQLDYWPSVSGFYLPVHYTKQFLPLSAIDTTAPDVNDLESRDIALLAASRIAQLIGRSEFVPGILADVASRSGQVVARRRVSLNASGQDNTDAAA